MTFWGESAQVSRRQADGQPKHLHHHETNLELPVVKLLCALDVPLGAQVAEGPELLPPPADGALVDLQDAGGRWPVSQPWLPMPLDEKGPTGQYRSWSAWAPAGGGAGRSSRPCRDADCWTWAWCCVVLAVLRLCRRVVCWPQGDVPKPGAFAMQLTGLCPS